MELMDLHAHDRRLWLQQEQQPRIKQQTCQSNFETTLAYRLAFIVAIFVIGLNLLSPDPTPSQPTNAAVRPTV